MEANGKELMQVGDCPLGVVGLLTRLDDVLEWVMEHASFTDNDIIVYDDLYGSIYSIT